MKQTFSDFSQLKKGMFKAAPPNEEQKPVAPTEAGLSRDDEEVLAYFSRPAGDAAQKSHRKPPVSAPAAKTTIARPQDDAGGMVVSALELRESESARRDAEERLASAEGKCADLAAELAAAQKEICRLQGESGRLSGELKKAAKTATVAAERKDEPLAVHAAEKPRSGVLAAPAAFAEAFPGELREMLVSVLSDARDAARQSTRERRAAVLDAVLTENRSTGELERRREALKQIMKDSGGYTDPRALAELGFKLVSGKTHWKVDYAGIRMPLAKTPSDYRANLNMATDMANRCF